MKRCNALVLALCLLLTLTACGTKAQHTDLSGLTSLTELNNSGAKIAAQSNTFHLEALKSQVNGITVSDLEDFTLLLTALNAGAIDGYVAEEPTAWAVCAKNNALSYIPLKNNTTGFAASDADVGIAVGLKKGSALTSQINAVVAGIPESVRADLMRQMVSLGDAPVKNAQTEICLKSQNTSTENGVLKIAMECNYQPYNWTQITNANGAVKIANTEGYANGYDVQVAAYIAAELGMALEIYAYKWDSLIPAVQSGKVDGIIAGMSPTAQRQEELDFSDCYWKSDLVIVIRKEA